ncbi:MAG: ABC transporter ATP-binding protein/permease [Acidobacteriota bacterium]|nr:ABC transporter ATP-binding protein/permease [Acidobacteriota bacterium]
MRNRIRFSRDSPDQRARRREAWRYYRHLYAGMHGRIVLALLAAIGQSAALLPVPLLIGYLLDRAIAADNLRIVLLAGAAVFAMHLLYSGLVLLTRHLLVIAESNAMTRLRNDLVDKLSHMSRAYYTQLDQSRTQTAIVHDTERVTTMSSALIDQFLPALISAVALIAIMTWVYTWLSLVTLTFVPILYWVLHILARRMKREGRNFRLRFEDFSRSISRLLQDMRLIEYTGSEAHSRVTQSNQIERLAQSSRAFSKTVIKHNVMNSLLAGVSGALVLVVGGSGIVAGRITPGQLLALYAGFSLLRNQWLALSRAFPQIITGSESLLALWDILRTNDPPPYNGTKQLRFTGHIQLDNIFFRYTDELILKAVDINIEAGAHVALIGESGAGKSTIVNLMLGFYRPERGQVLIDGHKLDELDLSYLRRQIGVVPQDPIIMPGTISENIAYGVPEATPEQIERAARVSGAHEFVMALPERYETFVGESGMLLSGGQRQRIAIARSLLRKPCFLILDEPTNHLDIDSLNALMDALRKLDTRPTMLIISHDMNVVRAMQMVYLIQNGTIVASGKPDLVLQDGLSV